jgi:hypothetical protein
MGGSRRQRQSDEKHNKLFGTFNDTRGRGDRKVTGQVKAWQSKTREKELVPTYAHRKNKAHSAYKGLRTTNPGMAILRAQNGHEAETKFNNMNNLPSKPFSTFHTRLNLARTLDVVTHDYVTNAPRQFRPEYGVVRSFLGGFLYAGLKFLGLSTNVMDGDTYEEFVVKLFLKLYAHRVGERDVLLRSEEFWKDICKNIGAFLCPSGSKTLKRGQLPVTIHHIPQAALRSASIARIKSLFRKWNKTDGMLTYQNEKATGPIPSEGGNGKPVVSGKIGAVKRLVPDSMSQLNGAQGEVTGTDDLDQPKRAPYNANDAKHQALRRKRAKNALHQRKTCQIRNDEDSKEERPAGRPRPPPPVINQMLVVQNEAVDLPPQKFLYPGPYGWDGKSCYEMNADGWFYLRQETGARLPPLPQGLVNAIDSGLGWALIDPSGAGQQVVVQPAFETRLLEEFYFYEEDGSRHHHLRAQYFIFVPALHLILEKLPGMKAEKSMQRGMISMLESRFGTSIPVVVLENTCLYAVGIKRRSSMTVQTHLDGVINNPNDYDRHNVAELQVDWDHQTIVVDWAIECRLPRDYARREDFRMEFEGTAQLYQGYPRLNTIRTRPRLYRTIMFRINGQGVQPFSYYDDSPHNMCCGISRLEKSRGEKEALYVRNQYGFGANMLWQRPELVKIAKILRARCIFAEPHAKVAHLLGVDPGENDAAYVTVGDHKHSHEYEVASRQDFMFALNRYVDDLVDRCKPSFIQCMMDTGRTYTNKTAYKVMELFTYAQGAVVGREYMKELPHIKRQLRRRYVDGQPYHTYENIMVKRLSGQVKRELAKFGKDPRLFVGYGAGAMYANEVPEVTKAGLVGRYETYGKVFGTIDIIGSPKPAMFDEVFRSAREHTLGKNTAYVALYSDDSIYTGCINGISYAYNVDISSCDTGQRWPIFLALYRCMAVFAPEQAAGLIQQCTLPISLVSKDRQEDKITVHMDGPFEGSGTVLTTLLNHVASYLIGRRFVDLCVANRADISELQDIENYITLAAEQVGHKISLESCYVDGTLTLEKLQFLKRSPLQTIDGAWTYSINYGTIFRSLGSLEGDMAAEQLGMDGQTFRQTPWEVRCDKYVSTIVAGLVHEPRSVVIDALRQRFRFHIDESKLTSAQQKLLTQHNFEKSSLIECQRADLEVCSASLSRRYDIPCEALGELAQKIANLRVGLEMSDLAAGAFYRVDYGAPETP